MGHLPRRGAGGGGGGVETYAHAYSLITEITDVQVRFCAFKFCGWPQLRNYFKTVKFSR